MTTAIAPDLGHLAFLVHTTLGTGPRAELKRLDPQRAATWPAIFWRLYSEHIEPRLGSEATSEPVQRTWATVLGSLALLKTGDVHPGSALARVGYSELRLNRLLSARDERLLDEFRAAVRFLAAKKSAVDWPQFALLILHDPDSHTGDGVRRHLAGAYYRTLAAKD